jgi:Na+-driven multidrug efflux pump
MDLEKTWEKMGEGSSLPEEWLNTGSVLRKPGSNPLLKLKKNLVINMAWGLLTLLIYVLLIVSFSEFWIRLVLAVMLVFSTWALVSTWMLHRKLEPGICTDCNVLDEMERYHRIILAWCQNQMKVALFFYPIAAATGFVLGGTLGAGQPAAVIMTKPLIQWTLLASILVITPLAWWLGKWMTRLAFGKYLDELKIRIDQLRSEG